MAGVIKNTVVYVLVDKILFLPNFKYLLLFQVFKMSDKQQLWHIIEALFCLIFPQLWVFNFMQSTILLIGHRYIAQLLFP